MLNSTNSIVKRLREQRLLEDQAKYDSMDDKELISLAQGGDQYAFETLLKNHEDFISRMLSKYFNNYYGDKEDMYQIAKIAFWDAVMSYDSGDFEAYAGMLIKRRLTDEVRKENTGKADFNNQADSFDRVVHSKPAGGPGEDHDVTLGDMTPNGKITPEDQVIANDAVQVILDYIQNDLSENERKFLKYYIQGYKVSEIADMTGEKYKSIENAIRRAKEKIRDYLADMDEAAPVGDNIFTEKELAVLKSVFNKLGESKDLDESMNESYLSKFKEILKHANNNTLDMLTSIGKSLGIDIDVEPSEEEAKKILASYLGKNEYDDLDESEFLKSVNGYTIKKDEDKETGLIDYHVFKGGKILATYDDLDLAIKDCESDTVEDISSMREAEKTSDSDDPATELIQRVENSDDKLSTLFKELVPRSGAAASKAGELVRAMTRILYRDYNDGDLFYTGYGVETAGPAESYLVTEVPDLESDFNNIAEKYLEGDNYTNALKLISDKLVNYILERPELIREKNDTNMQNASPRWEGYLDWEDDSEDEYYDEYDEGD